MAAESQMPSLPSLLIIVANSKPLDAIEIEVDEVKDQDYKDEAQSNNKGWEDAHTKMQGCYRKVWYMKRTAKLALTLKKICKVAYPDDFKIYEKAFETGSWKVVDPGPC
ncbi:hypothetical protein EV702DRAFT_1050660 [Suillus placidus]|uniref:Uncharacterized protein n=1 Tax=Suillus placidus TaxID=48579 RepID=A0A9P7CVR6_9AGAM|nr:hypothetical protein EV702DRAFT_1050660 [Suillus placidus]